MKYRVQLKKQLWAYVVVEADDPDVAIDAAFDGELPYLCGQCSGWGRDWSVTEDDEWQFPDDAKSDDPIWVEPIGDDE